MRKIERTGQLKRDYKRESKGQYSKVLDVALLDVLELILASKPLPAKTTGSMKCYCLSDKIQREDIAACCDRNSQRVFSHSHPF